MNARVFLILAVFCSISSRVAHADETDDFVRACKVAAATNRSQVEITVRCERGAATTVSFAIRVHTDTDIERWCSSTVADAVQEVEIGGDKEVSARGLRRLTGFLHLRRLIGRGFLEQADIDALSDLRSLEDLDLSNYWVASEVVGRFRAMPRRVQSVHSMESSGFCIGDVFVCRFSYGYW